MRTITSWSLFIALFLTTACSTTRLALEPIENQRELPMTYRTGWEIASLQPGSEPSELADGLSPLHVRVTLVRLSTRESETLIGPIGARPAALEVAPWEVDRLLAAIQAQSADRLVDSRSIAIEQDKRGEVRVARQSAYVAAFELAQSAELAIADPIVQVIEDGYLLRLTARTTPNSATCGFGVSLNLAVELVLSELEHPMRERVIALPGSLIPVTVQEPACMTQCIQTSASISATNALLIAGIPAREAGQTLLVVLRGE